MKQHINLLLEEEAIFLNAKRMALLLALFALILSLIVVFFIVISLLRSVELQNIEETYAKALNQVSLQPAKLDAQYVQEYEGLKNKLAAFESVQSAQSQINKTKFSEVFRALAQSKVPQAWINNIQLNNMQASIELQGKTTNPKSLIEMLKLLQLQPGLQEKGLSVFTIKREKSPNAYSFKMQGHL